MKLRSKSDGVVYDGKLLIGSVEVQELGCAVALGVTIDDDNWRFLQPDNIADFSIVWCTTEERKDLCKHGFIKMHD